MTDRQFDQDLDNHITGEPEDGDDFADAAGDDMVLVSYYEHSCEWVSKYCDENHKRSAWVPRAALSAALADAGFGAGFEVSTKCRESQSISVPREETL